MKTIVIAGAHSNIGKTSLAEEMLRNLPNWSALKVTVKKRASRCPRGDNCGVCDELKEDFDIVTDKKTISQRGTDTARLKEAGAEKVVWLRATLKGLRAGLTESLQRLKGSEGIVIEGTSVLRYVKPDLAVYLKDNATDLKSTAKEAYRKADIIVDIDR